MTIVRTFFIKSIDYVFNSFHESPKVSIRQFFRKFSDYFTHTQFLRTVLKIQTTIVLDKSIK